MLQASRCMAHLPQQAATPEQVKMTAKHLHISLQPTCAATEYSSTSGSLVRWICIRRGRTGTRTQRVLSTALPVQLVCAWAEGRKQQRASGRVQCVQLHLLASPVQCNEPNKQAHLKWVVCGQRHRPSSHLI